MAEGFPLEKAMEIAVDATEDFKAEVHEAGIEGIQLVAGASGWGVPAYGHPTIGIFLPHGSNIEHLTKKLAPSVAKLEERRIRVSIFPSDTH